MPTTPYEETAGTRPRVRRDVLFTRTPQGVIFHNAEGGFQLSSPSAYRFATLLVPHLDGSRTVAEICEGFKDPQRAMVGGLVKALYARGFARPVPDPSVPGPGPAVEPAVAARFAQQIAYIDHYADDAASRFAAFRGTRVAVLGDGPVAGRCALSLIRNGCAHVGVTTASAEGPSAAAEFGALRSEAAELRAQGSPAEVTTLPGAGPGGTGDWSRYEGYDVVVAACGRDAFGTATALLGRGVPEGRLLLPAWTFGGRAVVGPVGTPRSVGCAACAALRLGANGDAAEAAELWSGLALGTGTGTEPRGPLAAILGNLLGFEVFRLVTQVLPAESSGQVLIQDMASFDVLAERLLPHPRCPHCRTRPVPPEPVDLTAAPERPAFRPVVAAPPEDGATEGPLAELDRRSLAVRPSVGVFTRYADEPVTQTPLKVGAVEVGLGAAGTRTIAAFDVQHTAGARLRALNAAAEVYAEYVVPGLLPLDGSPSAGRPDAAPRVSPETLVTATGAGGDPVVSWVPAVSLLTKEPARVPAGAVRPFGPDNRDRLFEPSRAGAGAGGGLPEAAAAGLLSAVAYDALRRSVRGTGRVTVLSPAQLEGDPEAGFLLRAAGHMERDVELLDLGEAERTGVSVVLARTRPTEPGEPVRWAAGAALDRSAAAVDALRDLLGTVQLAAEGVLGVPDTGGPLLADLDAALVAVTAPGDAVGPGPHRTAVTWADVLGRLAASGRDALVVPTHAADLPGAGIHTVRVLLTKAADDDR
ncbi:TOMM precursor leader peptide-binding protein [Streptomyces sp. NBC_01216]|uniref:TOMM precursor leader peptide-binding protein n=1 Tax=unclassified Streptomyces TaxID=2593676 RepID=UPI002E1189BB|nr:TOMM precursor leader peptide-binding protein [Streptomyces sp. NBC_01216]